MDERMYKVFLVDNRDYLTEGFKIVMSMEDGIEILDSAKTAALGHDAVRSLFYKGGIVALPDVVVLDETIPDMSLTEATRVLKREFPMVKVLMIVTSEENRDIYEAIREGASGHVLRQSTPEEIAYAIRTVADGGALIDSETANSLLAKFADIAKGHADDEGFSATSKEVQKADGTLRGSEDFKPYVKK